MSKPARGTKRVCPSCGARFYDLNRSPITCPVCQAVYQMTPPTSSRRSERPAPAEINKPQESDTETSVVGGAEVISLEDAEENDDSSVDDEEIVDLGDGATDIPAGNDDEDTFLEEEEEGDTDVSKIVGGGTKEES